MLRRLAALAALLAAGCAGDMYSIRTAESESAQAFERMKALAGDWKGDFAMGESKGTAEVSYRVTGAGSVVEETLFRGTKHEMVTMYHRDGSNLLLTHYCAAGNQPTMVLVPGDDPAHLRFEFLRGTNMAAGDGHMHEAEFDFSNPDAIRTAWTYWEDGKPGHTAVLEMKRVR